MWCSGLRTSCVVFWPQVLCGVLASGCPVWCSGIRTSCVVFWRPGLRSCVVFWPQVLCGVLAPRPRSCVVFWPWLRVLPHYKHLHSTLRLCLTLYSRAVLLPAIRNRIQVLSWPSLSFDPDPCWAPCHQVG